jgi:16S rRNA (cytidine1402-2'-O)-methyltransferase
MPLFLLPNLLGHINEHQSFLPASVDAAVAQIDGLVAESEGEGRRYLKRFRTKKKPHEMPIALLTREKQDLDFLLEPIIRGETWGVLSDCGLPCLADPGATLVMRARELNIPIKAFSGPSSITLALMLSGLSGQNFFFHGYLPSQPADRSKALREWEKLKGVTHIFIEAPYRNLYTFKASLESLSPGTLFSVASSLTMPDEFVATLPIRLWKQMTIPDIAKKPTLFLFRNS